MDIQFGGVPFQDFAKLQAMYLINGHFKTDRIRYGSASHPYPREVGQAGIGRIELQPEDFRQWSFMV